MAFVNILQTSTLRDTEFLRSLYEERAENFEGVVSFLKDIGWIREGGRELYATTEAIGMFNASSFQIRAAIGHAMTKGSLSLQDIVSRYLSAFCVDDTVISHKPSAQSRLSQRGIRNFLIELEVVSYDPDDDRYLLNRDFADLYLWAKVNRGADSKGMLFKAAADREKLGATAELAALEFERTRIGPSLACKVEHIAAVHPFANYDIRSVTVTGDELAPRFIEVKAVSIDDYHFFWTSSEIQAARLLEDRYFIYLLPVLTENAFDLAKIMIVQNPYKTIYRCPDKWRVESDVVVCYKI